jgi:P-type E1-E2 ATPase
MIEIDIPGRGRLTLAHLVLDVNGTLAVDGTLLPGVLERVQQLRAQLDVAMLTADTHGRQAELDRQLGFAAHRLQPGRPEAAQKAAFVRSLGALRTAAIGNGANDVEMLRVAALGIAVLEGEGASVEAFFAADLAVRSITDALDLLLHPRRLVATLRR